MPGDLEQVQGVQGVASDGARERATVGSQQETKQRRQLVETNKENLETAKALQNVVEDMSQARLIRDGDEAFPPCPLDDQQALDMKEGNTSDAKVKGAAIRGRSRQ